MRRYERLDAVCLPRLLRHHQGLGPRGRLGTPANAALVVLVGPAFLNGVVFRNVQVLPSHRRNHLPGLCYATLIVAGGCERAVRLRVEPMLMEAIAIMPAHKQRYAAMAMHALIQPCC